jgi:hypothetical protein
MSGQIMCGGSSVHKELGGNSNVDMLQVWAWAQVAGAGTCTHDLVITCAHGKMVR